MFLPNVYHHPFAPTRLESITDCAEALSADLTLFEYGAGIGNVVKPLQYRFRISFLRVRAKLGDEKLTGN